MNSIFNYSNNIKDRPNLGRKGYMIANMSSSSLALPLTSSVTLDKISELCCALNCEDHM